MWYIYTHRHMDYLCIYMSLDSEMISEVHSKQRTTLCQNDFSWFFFFEALWPQKSHNRHVTKMVFCFLHIWNFSFCFTIQEAEQVGDNDVVQLSLLFPHFPLLFVFLRPFFVSLWPLLWERGRVEAQHINGWSSTSLSCHHPFSSCPNLLQDESRYDCFILSRRV